MWVDTTKLIIVLIDQNKSTPRGKLVYIKKNIDLKIFRARVRPVPLLLGDGGWPGGGGVRCQASLPRARALPQVGCDWWRPGHVTTCSPLIGPQGDEHGAAGAEGGHHGPDDDGDRWELNNQYWNLKNPKMLILLFIIKFQNNLYFWPQAPCSPCPEPTWPSPSRRLPRPTQPPSH